MDNKNKIKAEKTEGCWKGWKVLAIIFIILFILETSFIIWGINLATDEENRKSECAYNTCKDYDAFFYEPTSQICYCYTDKEIVYQKFMK
jgi:hypothetical protein